MRILPSSIQMHTNAEVRTVAYSCALYIDEYNVLKM